MFTGIVEARGVIRAARSVAGGRLLSIESPEIVDGLQLGASVCVSGVCLTVSAIQGCLLQFEVVAETLSRSTLGDKQVGSRVNLERSLRVGDRLDGHFVQGHVDGLAVVDCVEASPKEWVGRFRPSPDLLSFLIPKGSVALDGVSLTLASVDDGCYSVALIPTTLKRTTLADLAAGDRVNVETDVIARVVVHQYRRLRGDSGLTLEKLRAAGFP